VGRLDKQDMATTTAPPVTGARLDLLRSLGFDVLDHDSHVPFLSHLVGTRRLLVAWDASPALCDAGLFHSVYGTEYFEPHQRPDRGTVTAVIGTEAERRAWLWCSIERATLDAEARTVRLRATGADEPLTDDEVADIATLWVADTVEQVARMAPGERAFTNGLLAVAGHASHPAQDALQQVRPLLEG
jgi:Domain of unknown function (DUF6817)